MAVQANPDILVLFPIRLKKWIVVGAGMNARLPFFINLPVALATGFCLEAGQSLRDPLKRNGMRVVRAKPEDDDRFDLGVIEIGRTGEHKRRERELGDQSHDSNSACRWRSTEAANAARL